MARLQVVALPGCRFGLVIDDASDVDETWHIPGFKAADLGAEFFIVVDDRVDVVR